MYATSMVCLQMFVLRRPLLPGQIETLWLARVSEHGLAPGIFRPLLQVPFRRRAFFESMFGSDEGRRRRPSVNAGGRPPGLGSRRRFAPLPDGTRAI